MRIKIFSFHRVSKEVDFLWQPMQPNTFENIIQYLLKNYTIVDLEKTILNPLAVDEQNQKLAAITFDDGYKDILDFAVPYLLNNKIPFSVFVITDSVTNQRPPWTFVLDYLLTYSDILQNPFGSLLPNSFSKNDWVDKHSRMLFAQKLKPYLKTTNNNFRKEVIEMCLDTFDDITIPTNLMMSWDDIRSLHNKGVAIGSHSHTHPLLHNVSCDDEIRNEFLVSKEILLAQLGTNPTMIAYSVGGVDERIKKSAKDSGYQLGLMVQGEMYNSHVHDHFEIPRIELYEESSLKFKLRINGSIQRVKRMYNFILPSKYSKL